MKILIVGINYAPEETGVAPYTTGLAEYLSARGAAVTVLTGMPHYPQWRTPDSHKGRWRIAEQTRGVEVRRFRHYVPRRQSALRRALYEATFFANATLPGRLRTPDLVVGIIPSLSGGALAAILAKRFGVPFVLLFQDLMGQAANQSGVPGGRCVGRVARAVEGGLARRAAGVAVVSEGFRDYLERLGVLGDRIVHTPNWTHIRVPSLPRADIRARFGWPNGVTIVLHAGNMGFKQALEHVVEAARCAAQARDSMRFVLMGDGHQRAALEALGAGCPTLQFLDPQPADLFPNVLAAADILLVSERSTVVDMSLPSKLTSYFAAGRPVLAAVASAGGTAREIERSGAGVSVQAEDTNALLGAIADLQKNPTLAAGLGEAGRRYADACLNAERTLGTVLNFLERITRVGRSAVGTRCPLGMPAALQPIGVAEHVYHSPGADESTEGVVKRR